MNGTDHLRRFPAGDPRGAGMAHAIRNETPGSAEPVWQAILRRMDAMETALAQVLEAERASPLHAAITQAAERAQKAFKDATEQARALAQNQAPSNEAAYVPRHNAENPFPMHHDTPPLPHYARGPLREDDPRSLQPGSPYEFYGGPEESFCVVPNSPPLYGRRAPARYPFRLMDVGSSFDALDNMGRVGHTSARQKNIATCASEYCKKFAPRQRFSTHRMNGFIRCRRDA